MAITEPVLRPPEVSSTVPPHVVPGKTRIDYDSLLNKPSGGFDGFVIETFAGTTDVNGKMVVNLKATPKALNFCFCLVAEAERHVEPASIAGKALTIQKRKLLYQKPDSPTGLATAPVGGGGIASGPFDTGDTSPGGGATTTTAPVGGASGDAVVSVDSITVDAHHHSVDSVIDHKHTLLFTPTSFDIADHEPTQVLVLYQ